MEKMYNPYPHTHIWINGRNVSIQAITEGKTVCVTDFEKNTFDFIKEWVTGNEIFQLKTSGSTGAAKDITLTRKEILASARLTIEALGLKGNFNALVCVDTRFI